MRTWQLNLLLVMLLIVTGAVGILFGRRDTSRPNFEIMPNMVHSIPYDAFAPGPDGTRLPRPVAGTIPRGSLPLHYEATEEDATRAGEELTNPFSSDDDVLAQGEHVFATFCTPCHGQNGVDPGLVVARGFPAPPPLTGGALIEKRDGEIFHALTHGKGNMPGHAAQISREDRWKVILYVRQMQQESLEAAAEAAELGAEPEEPATESEGPTTEPEEPPAEPEEQPEP